MAAAGENTSSVASLMMPAVFGASLCVHPQGGVILLYQLAAMAWLATLRFDYITSAIGVVDTSCRCRAAASYTEKRKLRYAGW